MVENNLSFFFLLQNAGEGSLMAYPERIASDCPICRACFRVRTSEEGACADTWRPKLSCTIESAPNGWRYSPHYRPSRFLFLGHNRQYLRILIGPASSLSALRIRNIHSPFFPNPTPHFEMSYTVWMGWFYFFCPGLRKSFGSGIVLLEPYGVHSSLHFDGLVCCLVIIMLNTLSAYQMLWEAVWEEWKF